jgi:N-acyl-phosphatidylethanolamine-hydrolysing phospholipase D
VVALGTPEGGDRWRLLVRGPEGGYAGIVGLRDQALSVSGSLGQWSEIEGRRLGHVIDPRSGEPLGRPLVALALAPTAGDAEAWSKALLVLGEREGIAALEAATGVEGLLLGEGGPLAATTGFAAAARFEASSEPLGPAPRDAEGRFQNFDGPRAKAPASVTLPFFARRVFGFLRDVAGAPARVPDPLAELAHHSEATVTWIGHATVLVHHDGVRYLTDPAWSDRAGPYGAIGARRFVAPALPLEHLPPLDFVLISHNHYDHLDLPTLVELQRRQPAVPFFVPLGNGALLRGAGLRGVTELDWGESAEVGPVEVHCLPAKHWSARGLRDQNAALWSSWAVLGAARRVFFAGDSGAFPGFAAIGRRLGPFDLAALPIGAYEPAAMMKAVHLNPEEAIEAARSLGARRTLGIHWGTFDLTDEPLGEPPARFLRALRTSGLPDDAGWVFRIGETRSF